MGKRKPQSGYKGKHKPTEQQENSCLLFSLRHFDDTQECASSFDHWEEKGHLSKMMNCIKHYSNQTIAQAQSANGNKFCIYGDFPCKSDFTIPLNTPEDAKWARFHVGNLLVVAGYIVQNVFYIVFLDSEHRFYKSNRE